MGCPAQTCGNAKAAGVKRRTSDMSGPATLRLGDGNIMKKLAFACLGAAVLLASGCNRNNADQVNNAEMNQYGAEQLNDLANEADNNAEAEALGNQQQQLEAQNAATNTDNTTNPGDAEEQNVAGM